MSDRKALIYQAIKENPYAKLPTISVDIKKRTGKGVAIPALMELRDAVAAGAFDTVYAKLFEGAKDAPVAAKRSPGRPRKKPSAKVVSHVSAPIHQGEVAPLPPPAIKRGPGRPRKDGTPAQPAASQIGQTRAAKQRGDRRAKYELRGRRKADLDKIQLSDFSDHLVVYRKDGALQQATFKSRDRAEALVRELLNAGHVATEIAYYKLNPIKATVTVTV